MNAAAVKSYLNDLHDRITAAVEGIDTVKFRRDTWTRSEGGGGESRVLSAGTVFERAGFHLIIAVKLNCASGAVGHRQGTRNKSA